jgi:hypothetical protein
VDLDSSKNYMAPATVKPQNDTNLQTTMSWTSFIGLSNETGPNGDQVSMGYDAMARPSSSTSPHGAVTNYSYTNSPPTKKATTNGHWVKTTMDGLGRPIKVESGDGTSTKSVVDTEYAACACSPIGKMWRVSQPYAPGVRPGT